MSAEFHSPSFRAASSDLTIAISPLGLVELADEEFEVHGPRLNRYASSWAWYLGHHHAYRREVGDQHITLNYVRAFADYINNFCFGKGVQFRTSEQNAAIIPHLLHKVWEVDNDKSKVLWEMGQLATVTGDCFVKVAYEAPYQDSLGVNMPGRTRIIPLNPAHCFPEYHPHDRDRLLRFKLKYRFWGCVDTDTEALTRDGWKRHDEITASDEVLALDPDTDEMTWQPVDSVEVYDYDGHMVQWDNHLDAVTTPNHRWVAERQRGRGDTTRYEREIVRTEFPIDDDAALKDLRKGSRLILGGGTPLAFRDAPKFSDELVEAVGWYVTEGWDHTNQTGYQSIYLSQKRPEGVARIRRIQKAAGEGATFNEYAPKSDGVITWSLGNGVGTAIREVAPNKSLTPEFITSLTFSQAQLLFDTLMLADGNVRRGSERWTQLDEGRVSGFQMLCAMLGKRTRYADEKVQIYKSRHVDSRSTTSRARRVHTKDGKIWSPVINGGEGVWFARRNGSTYWTGNTSPEGTRQVYTFTEILTDDTIEQYINDEMIDKYDNPIGHIPIVHIPNVTISSSPWGQSDIWDIISLNRELNEKMTDVSDIINYHAAPVTIITGAKANQLEKGAKKVWAGLPKDARVFNLESKGEMGGSLEFIQALKRSMHEITGVPETALGQTQPISNTSGVALAIQYQPMMNRYLMKKVHFSKGLERVNNLIIRTQAVHEPWTLNWDPSLASYPEKDQATQLDPTDAATYKTQVHWPDPLPVDALILLNELQAKMGMGLESKRGALRALGEEFPNEKMAEVYEELMEDQLDQGALDMVSAQISAGVMAMTGILPDGTMGPSVTSAKDSAEDGVLPGVSPEGGEIVNQLVQRAYGANLAQRRVPDGGE